MKKIGLFGGTFDPIHNGHLIIAEYLRDDLGLEEIWFVPAKIHPLKNNFEITSPEHRLKMLLLAIQDNPNFKVTDVELQREGVSFTIDTIDELYRRNAALEPRFFFFIGMDNVNELYKWKDPRQILRKAQVVAFGRPGFKADKKAKEFIPLIKFVHVPLLEISSTYIRQRIQKKRSVRYLIPAAVEQYIREKHLYM
ncbi:hypothetical protein B1H10_01075 [candidate division KSB1 bacterium 4484_188]|nr:MAG: hypothetical protein B1H10_01075 [candidate division KSB1 bacterium 4484_188]